MESRVGRSVEQSFSRLNGYLRYSTFKKRFFAGIIDGIFLIIIFIYLDIFLTGETNIIISCILEFIPFIYSILMHGYFGQTIGKQFMGVKVVNSKDEKSITYFQAFKRDAVPIYLLVLGYILIAYGSTNFDTIDENKFFILIAILGTSHSIWFILEIFTMLLNEKRRAIHDLIAGTVVIRK